MSRRQFTRLASAAACGVAATRFAWGQAPPAGARLGICSISYALRWPALNKGQAGIEEMLAFVDHCHGLGAGGVQTAVRTDPGFAASLRAKLEQNSMSLEGQIGLPHSSADLERFEREVRAAKEAGASVLRTACLGSRRYETFSDPESFRAFAQRAEQWLLEAEPIARKHQVRLAVENHKDWRIPELLRLLERISSEYVGVCVDTGNSIALLEDPMAVVEAYAPFALSTHLKDMAVQESERGFLLAEVALGEGFLDLAGIVRTLRRARPELRFTLEMITRDPLLIPCLAKPYWATFETLPGWVLAAALALVRKHASKQELPLVSAMSQAQKLESEDAAVRKSLQFARRNLQL